MNRSIRHRRRSGLLYVVVLFAISLQLATLSSLLSALHEVEHAAELASLHSSGEAHHHHGPGAGHHHGRDAGADATGHDVVGAWQVVDGHVLGLDPAHVSGEHGFFHSPTALTLLDHVAALPSMGGQLRADPPVAPSRLGMPRPEAGVPHRPPIA